MQSLADYVTKDKAMLQEDKYVITLPSDQTFLGADIANVGWSPLPKINPFWLNRELVIRCKGRSSIVPDKDSMSYGGHSVGLFPGAGKVTFENFDFYAGGRSIIQTGSHGSQEKKPIGLTLRKCQLLNQPAWAPKNATVFKWGITANQTYVRLEECRIDIGKSKEHIVYLHNPTDQMSWMINCKVVGCGGQVWQEVNRQSEGPNYEGEGGTIIRNNFLMHYHKDESRAGFAVTIAGSGRSVLIEKNAFLQPWTKKSHGAIVVWRGGNKEGHGGLPDWYGPEEPWGTEDNRGVDDVVIRDNLIYHLNPSKPLISLASYRRAIVRNNALFTNPNYLTVAKLGDGDESHAPEHLLWTQNNSKEAIFTAMNAGFPEPIGSKLKIDGRVIMSDLNIERKVDEDFAYVGTEEISVP